MFYNINNKNKKKKEVWGGMASVGGVGGGGGGKAEWRIHSQNAVILSPNPPLPIIPRTNHLLGWKAIYPIDELSHQKPISEMLLYQ